MFIKASNRAKDLDCYDALTDIERLQHFKGYDIRKFICLTDNKYYPETLQTGHRKTVTLNIGTVIIDKTKNSKSQNKTSKKIFKLHQNKLWILLQITKL